MAKLSPYSVEYNLTEHCNLSCYACDHASPLMAAKFAPIDDFSRDFEALSEVAHAIELRLVGGEPLLHPQLPQFLTEAHRIGIANSVVIYTNGVLLHRTPSEIWDLVDEVRLSEYPGVRRRLDDTEYARISEAHNVRFLITQVTSFSRTLVNNRIEDPELVAAIFSNCGNTGCHTVHDGRFYRCSIAPFMSQRLALLGIEFENSTNDGVALHGNPRLYEELQACLSGRMPLAACSFCLGTSGPAAPHHQLNRKGRSKWLEEDNTTEIDHVRKHLLPTCDGTGPRGAPALTALAENLVVCMGVYRSASTMVADVVRTIFQKLRPELRVHACSAERLGEIPWGEVCESDVFILETHDPDEALLSFLETGKSRMFISVRDPRDCAASWRTYLRDPYDYLMSRLARSWAAAAKLADHKADALVVRYESAVTNCSVVVELARHLGLAISLNEGTTILHAANRATKDRTIPTDDTSIALWLSDQFPRENQRKILSPSEITFVNSCSKAYCEKFGYDAPAPAPLPCGRSVLQFTRSSEAVDYLERGFSLPEEGHVWTDHTEATVRIPLAQALTGRTDCELRYFAPPEIPGEPMAQAWVTLATSRLEIRKRVGLSARDEPVVRFVVEDPELVGSLELAIRISIDRLFCPRDFQINDDDRTLGLALQSLTVVY